MKYFCFITHELSLKNNLDKAALDLLKEHNRTIIDGKDIEWFKDEINKSIERLNGQFKRCKPLKPSWWQSDRKAGDWTMNSVGSCTFNLYATKK